MELLSWLLIVPQIVTFVFGKHIPVLNKEKRKAFPRQMIIPNKFIPMLKESALFKSRSSSNDLSDFLKPKARDDVTGKTRQNLMNAMGIDGGPSQAEGGMGGGGMGMEGMGQGGMGPENGGAMGGGMPGLAAMRGSEGMGSEGGVGEGGGLEELAKMTGGMGGPEGMNDQMNGMGGMSNNGGGENPMEGLMGGNNAMNPMNNAGPEGMMSDSNQLPAGDPMGTLKSMLDNQGTNAALGTNSEAFGPGGSANANVLAMLNQIVGKEMPGESPVDPSSKQQEMWDQLQKQFSSQRQAVQPYIQDSSESKSHPAPTQQDAPSNPASTKNPSSSLNAASANSGTSKQNSRTPVYNLTGLSRTSSDSKQNLQLKTSKPEGNTPSNNIAPAHTTEKPEAKVTSSALETTQTNLKSQTSSNEKGMTKTTSNPSASIDLDDNQPLSDDMVKFLKGIKFVVSQEPGNDIILGKKFTSDVSPASKRFEEENGVMKNVVTEKNKENKGKKKIPANIGSNNEAAAVVKDLKGINLSYARNLLLRRDVKIENSAEYQKAAKVLERASRKLNDPIARKSTDIAIASILKVLELKSKKKSTSALTSDLLTGGDVKSGLPEKYFEAARVLGTASKKLEDPVAKKSAEIGIASILKVIALNNYSLSKKSLVPFNHYDNDVAEMYFR